MIMENLKGYILGLASDAMTDFLYYDRKEDSSVGVGVIENAIIEGVITIDEILEVIREELVQSCEV